MRTRRSSARRSARRQQRQPVELRAGTVGKVLIMLAVVAAFVLGVAIFFQVRQVEVQGNRIYSEEQVVSIAGVEPGDNLLTVNRAAVAGRIRAELPYVEKVSVGRILPDTVVVKIEESNVAGLVQSDVGSSWYINSEGRVMGASVDGFEGQVIELTGFTITAPKAGQQAVAAMEMTEQMEAALSVMQAMDSTGLLEMVTTIQAEKSYDLRLLCGDKYEVRLGGTDELDYKVWLLQEVLKQLDPYQTGVIDLTMDERRIARFIPWE